MISYYPGPSKIYPQIRDYLLEAADSGILSVNHRSEAFMDLSEKCVRQLKAKLDIPVNYEVYYTSSATEGWEITLQSLVKFHSFHCFNGSFGERWKDLGHAIIPKVQWYSYDISSVPDMAQINNSAELFCLTQNETSNGTQIPLSGLTELRKRIPDKLIAVDVTSSLGGIPIDFMQADVWLASVQKCLGLPAGLGLMICSPAAIEKAKELKRPHYNNLSLMHDRMVDWQTTYTPSVLHIYLLARVAEHILPVKDSFKQLKKARQNYEDLVSASANLKILSQGRPEIRSDTVIAVAGQPSYIKQIKLAAYGQGLLLGNGYGIWKNSTFRIANFPALTEEDHQQLLDFLRAAG